MLDMSGRRYGRLVVESHSHYMNGSHMWKCLCDCGNVKVCRGSSLRYGYIRSCGCLKIEATIKSRRTHGDCPKEGGSPTYISWCAMIQRCTDKNSAVYLRYGARGIKVCRRWFKYENFKADMGERPKGTSLDRFPNQKGNYEPSNCRWATPIQQGRNSARNHLLKFMGKSKPISEWAEIIGISQYTIAQRINKLGWPIEKALTP